VEINSKKKGRLLAITIVLILILPLCYALVREYCTKHPDAKQAAPVENKVGK
jgi:hypothetical protein